MNISLVFASLICLATPLGNALRIVQPYHVVANDGQATVKCGYSTPPRPTPQELRVTLLKGLHGAEAVCGGYVNSTHRSVRTPEPNACQASMSEDGLSVSLSGLKGDDTDMYRCVVEVIYPPPYMKRVGNGTLVYVPEKPDCSLPEFQLRTQKQAEEQPSAVDQATGPTPTQEDRHDWKVQWVELPLPLVMTLGILIVLSIIYQMAGIRHTRRYNTSTQPLQGVRTPKIIT
ncbi:cytotoxic T-lymphocyte protein 4 isoform X1 [Clupea harengus]|uniref:Cytotoxic T-lymphocyte protein 4 isoform X1 n=1 Tax=Clupea harengus TaxID=7950 RepID=A0A6P8GHK5_CLUHA|nr:cytotoxic T-lymphocyte protein 4 isoform X1 [Clupea harengus]